MELKPCPFCGGEARVFQTFDLTWEVYCCNCTARIFDIPDDKEAIEEWNRRADNG